MANKLSALQKLRSDVKSLLDESSFRPDAEPSRVYRFLHFWVLVWNSFVRNRCPIRASALSFATLLALIPMLAVAFSVTSSLLKDEGEEQIENFIDKFVSGVMPNVVINTNTVGTLGDGADEAPDAPADGALPPSNWAPEPIPVERNEAVATAPTNGSARLTNAVSTVARDATNFVGPIENETGLEAPAESTAAAPNAIGETNLAASATMTNLASLAQDTRVIAVQKEAAREINQFIQNIQSGALGITGVIALVFMAISMLSRIEETFNDIWGVTVGRSWYTRVVVYWAAITLGPLLAAGVLALWSGPHLDATQDMLAKAPKIGALIFRVLPLGVLWLIFALFYKAVPNTRVNFSAAFVGGVIAGTLWHLNTVFGFLFVSRVVMNSKIYGSLALVPVFMFGLYLSWLILLFGAQIAYAFQNRALYLQEKLTETVNQRGREFVALRIMTCLGQRFQRGHTAATVADMSRELGAPTRLIQQVLQTLVSARLVTEASGDEPGYVPARPLETINAHHLLMAMRATPGQELLTRDEPVRAEVYGEFARIQDAEKSAACAVTLLALVDRAQTRLALTPPSPFEEEFKLKPALVPSAVPESGPMESRPAGPLPPPPATENEKPAAKNVPAVDFSKDPNQAQPATEAAPAKTVAAPESDENRESPL